MIRYDCRHYVGYKPCQHKQLCAGCGHYDRITSRILIIKLGALGDLFRTTPILPSLRAQYPGAHITWLTRPDCTPLLANLTDIDRIWITDANSAARVMAQEFDLMINFDKETPAVELAMLSRASKKRGFGINAHGALFALNKGSQYALDLGLNDELKFRYNQKTYQHIVHEMAELPIEGPGPRYQVKLTDEEIAYGRTWISNELGQTSPAPRVIGINAGAGRVFATKKWQAERYAEVAVRLHREHQVVPMLLGGADEVDLNDKIFKLIRKHGVPVLRPGETQSMRQFMSLVNQCDGFLTGDTLGMHLALAFSVPTVILFTSTCSQEIELYGTGRAIVGKAGCAPCYLSKCKQASQICADNIAVEDVYQAVITQMGLGQSEELRRSSNF